MHAAGGETPGWQGRRYALHHAIVAGNLAYGAWRDGADTGWFATPLVWRRNAEPSSWSCR